MIIHAAILTSGQLGKLQRAVESCTGKFQEITVVINTMNPYYRDSAMAWCQENCIDYVVTESNGTPSKGKNSMIQYLKSCEADYYFMLDGDDTVHEKVEQYLELYTTYYEPDILSVQIPDELSAKMYADNCIGNRHYAELRDAQLRHATNFRVVLANKKGLDYINYNEDLHTLEDIHLQFRLLQDQKTLWAGKMYHAKASDSGVYIYDMTTRGNFIASASSISDKEHNDFFERFWHGIQI